MNADECSLEDNDMTDSLSAIESITDIKLYLSDIKATVPAA